jgi:hypothetical protein
VKIDLLPNHFIKAAIISIIMIEMMDILLMKEIKTYIFSEGNYIVIQIIVLIA